MSSASAGSRPKTHGLDLSSWDSAVNAAEPIRASTIDRFVEAYRAYGFRAELSAGYGLAEATLMVSSAIPASQPAILSVDPSAWIPAASSPPRALDRG